MIRITVQFLSGPVAGLPPLVLEGEAMIMGVVVGSEQQNMVQGIGTEPELVQAATIILANIRQRFGIEAVASAVLMAQEATKGTSLLDRVLDKQGADLPVPRR